MSATRGVRLEAALAERKGLPPPPRRHVNGHHVAPS